MIRKHGKPIDILKFKRALLDYGVIRSIIKKNCVFGRKVAKSNSGRVVKCPLCSSRGEKVGPQIFHIGYCLCKKCGLYFADRMLPQEQVSGYYRLSKSYSRFSYADKKVYRYRAKEVSFPKIRFVSQFLKPTQRRWLDVGSGIGDVVYNLKKRGFNARGIEISDTSVAFARDVFGVTLEKTSVNEVLKKEGEGSFDVVSYFGVLEHMPYPLKEIQSALRLLSPGGVIVMEVPNAKSFSVKADFCFPASVVRQATPFLHLMLFSEQTLGYLSKKFNLRPLGIWFLGLDFYNLILHLGAQKSDFFRSELCQKMLELNNDIQSLLDKRELSDEIIFVAQKTGSKK